MGAGAWRECEPSPHKEPSADAGGFAFAWGLDYWDYWDYWDSWDHWDGRAALGLRRSLERGRGALRQAWMAQVGPRVMWDGAWAMWGGVRSVGRRRLGGASQWSQPSQWSHRGVIAAWRFGLGAVP